MAVKLDLATEKVGIYITAEFSDFCCIVSKEKLAFLLQEKRSKTLIRLVRQKDAKAKEKLARVRDLSIH